VNVGPGSFTVSSLHRSTNAYPTMTEFHDRMLEMLEQNG
jgi:hypothetical protein